MQKARYNFRKVRYFLAELPFRIVFGAFLLYLGSLMRRARKLRQQAR